MNDHTRHVQPKVAGKKPEGSDGFSEVEHKNVIIQLQVFTMYTLACLLYMLQRYKRKGCINKSTRSNIPKQTKRFMYPRKASDFFTAINRYVTLPLAITLRT